LFRRPAARPDTTQEGDMLLVRSDLGKRTHYAVTAMDATDSHLVMACHTGGTVVERAGVGTASCSHCARALLDPWIAKRVKRIKGARR